MKIFERFMAISAAVISTHARADDLPRPGLYKIEATVSSNQMPTGSRQESEQCIQSEQFQTDPGAWIQNQAGQGCEVTQYSLTGGVINLALTCTLNGTGDATITGVGTYTGDGWEMKNVMRVSCNGLDMEIIAEMSSVHVGDY